MKHQILTSLIIFGLFAYSANAQAVLENKVYEDNIQTVRLYPESDQFSDQFQSPAVPLNASMALVLEFDDIAYEADRYSAKLIHCNADWTVSGLKDADFLVNYNEFNLDEYAYAIDTRIPYIHFTFRVPRVTKSGNYLLKVYRGRNEKEVILTQRFMVYNNQVNIGAQVVPPSQTTKRQSSQQINFNINYGDREVVDPMNQIKVLIRQNQRWDNAITGLKPTFIREDRSVLEYQIFDGSNTFSAGNEFRFIDLRYVRTRGRNIASINIEEDAVFAETTVDQPRDKEPYLEYLDLNGQYAVFNFEKQNHGLESEYVLTTFNFRSQPMSSPPYVLGALSNWGRNPEAKMEYNKEKGLYQATLLLKQGWYDYQYGIPTDGGWDIQELEGENFQTENEYEILVYYRAIGSRYDELIGYTVLNPNKRRL